MIVMGEPLRAWTLDRLGERLALSPDAKFIGRVTDEGYIMAVVAFDGWNGWNLDVHIAAAHTGAINLALLRSACDYAYRHVGAHRMTAFVVETNEAMADRLIYRLGFQYEGRVREGLTDGRDVLIFGMLRSECPWVRNRRSNPLPRTPGTSSISSPARIETTRTALTAVPSG